MVIDWGSKKPDPHEVEPLKVLRAAAYVRMSTEHQRYSTDNQMESIKQYADRNHFDIVRVYTDEGKSGLSLTGRDALQSLLSDVEAHRADYEAVLVYDVSRWGRFQDPDEAAEIELRCKRHKIRVHYCAEQFVNDGSIGASIIKTVKRAMAGEYSRELSVKVRVGQANLIRLGFRQGGPPGYGLRRMLVDHAGNPKGELSRGEQKSIATDRVILVPGPENEVNVVLRIYNLFIRQRRLEAEIAAVFNGEGIKAEHGGAWTRGTIHEILINEKYVGHNVWGRTSFTLKQAHVRNPKEAWVRANGAFQGIVPTELFAEARAIIDARSDRLSDAEMLEKLAQILSHNGYLTGLIIDEADNSPSSSAFSHRFGSLLRAYALVGFVPDRDYRFLEVNRALRRMYPRLIREIIDRTLLHGGAVQQNPTTDLLDVNGEFTASLVIARCFQTAAGSLRWKVRLDTALRPDVTVVIRMNSSNEAIHDYYLLPKLDMREAVYRLCEFNGLSLDAYRFETLDRFFAMAARKRLMEMA